MLPIISAGSVPDNDVVSKLSSCILDSLPIELGSVPEIIVLPSPSCASD
eukprot:COSAG01_NODE_51228_length_356_cov_1.190661_2_plen_48_part_01